MNYYVVAVVYVILLMIPAEFYFNLGGARLELYRLFLLYVLLASFPRIINTKFNRAEFFIFLLAAWIFMAAVIKKSGMNGLETGVLGVLQVLGSYLIGKYCGAQRPENSVNLLKFMGKFFLLLVPFGILEALNGERVFHILAGSIMGNPYEAYLGDKYIRYGIHRASVIFAHPIHYGVASVLIGLVLSIVLKGPKRYVAIVTMLVGSVVSVSSVAFLMMIAVSGMLVVERLAGYFKVIRKLVAYGLLGLLAFVQLFSNQGVIQFIVLNISLNPWTAYSRYLQWYYAWDDVMKYPFIGVPFGSGWTRPFWMVLSVDAYWLKISIVTGLASAIIAGCFWFLSIKRMYSLYLRFDDNVMKAWSLTLIALVVGTFTVDLFDRIMPLTYLFFGLGCGYADRLEKDFKDSAVLNRKFSKGGVVTSLN